MIKLFVGLGNPGFEYESTRHNAGFWFLDELADSWKASFSLDKTYQAHLARITLENESVWLLKPQTYMNLSGRSVAALARFYKIQANEILVAHDELDLEPSQAKLKFGGGHAGHNGLRDIHAQLGSDQYWRLRLGIGHPGIKSEVANWVLKKPSLDHRIAIENCIARCLTAARDLQQNRMEVAMKIIHTQKEEKPKKPKESKPNMNPEPKSSPSIILAQIDNQLNKSCD